MAAAPGAAAPTASHSSPSDVPSAPDPSSDSDGSMISALDQSSDGFIVV